MSDIPIGFGVAARSTADCRHADPLATIAFHQADVGEYIRSEDTLVWNKLIFNILDHVLFIMLYNLQYIDILYFKIAFLQLN